MEIATLSNNFVEGTTKIAGAVTDFVVWSGHQLKLIVKDSVIPAMQKLRLTAQLVARNVANIIKAGPVLPFTVAAGLFFMGIAAFKIADHKAYEEETFAKTAWKIAGIAAFSAATVATSVGIASFVMV